MKAIRITLCLLGLTWVASAQEIASGTSESDLSERSSTDYILQPLDLVQVRIFQETDMDREVRISQENTVTLPLIGRVNLKGKTISETELILRNLYDQDYLVNPQVNVVVLEYSRRTVKVLGMVGNPGEIDFPREEGLTLMAAISRAGGFTRLAQKKQVTITRKLDSGRIETFTIDAEKLINGDSEKQWILQTDDLISVPERFL
jgi:polysaccharide export outer membrane protein